MKSFTEEQSIALIESFGLYLEITENGKHLVSDAENGSQVKMFPDRDYFTAPLLVADVLKKYAIEQGKKYGKAELRKEISLLLNPE